MSAKKTSKNSTSFSKTIATDVGTLQVSASPATFSSTTDRQKIQANLSEMIHYASTRGIPIPASISLDTTVDNQTLIANYNTMVEAVKPATSQAIHYIRVHISRRRGR